MCDILPYSPLRPAIVLKAVRFGFAGSVQLLFSAVFIRRSAGVVYLRERVLVCVERRLHFTYDVNACIETIVRVTTVHTYKLRPCELT